MILTEVRKCKIRNDRNEKYIARNYVTISNTHLIHFDTYDVKTFIDKQNHIFCDKQSISTGIGQFRSKNGSSVGCFKEMWPFNDMIIDAKIQ